MFARPSGIAFTEFELRRQRHHNDAAVLFEHDLVAEDELEDAGGTYGTLRRRLDQRHLGADRLLQDAGAAHVGGFVAGRADVELAGTLRAQNDETVLDEGCGQPIELNGVFCL